MVNRFLAIVSELVQGRLLRLLCDLCFKLPDIA